VITGINTQPNFEAIPQELKELKRWIVWKLVKTDKFKKNGDVKYTKPPYSAKTHRKSSITNKKTWATFEEAKAAFEEGGYAGIGFVFVRGDGLVGIDLDECFDEYGELNEYGQQVMSEVDSYTENSPSRDGLHTLARGELPGKGHCDNSRGIEMYDEGRFFTFTGDVYRGKATIEDRKLEVVSLYHDWFDGVNGSSGGGSAKPGAYKFDSKAEIKELDAIQLAQDIVDLVRDGTGMDQFNGDRSVAIFSATRAMLNAGANPETIATIFSDSSNFLSGAALERRGGNVESARCWLLDQIIMKQKEAYDAEMALLCDDDFEVIDEGRSDNADPKKSKTPAGSYGKNFERNAVTYLNTSKVKLYREKCYAYDGRSWVKLTEGELVGRITKELSGQGMSMSVMNNTTTYIKRRTVVESFEASPAMLAFRNGVIDLVGWDTGKVDLTLRPHHPKYNIRALQDYDYDPYADCLEWLKFLDSSFEGDQERVRQLQQWFGYCLIYDYRFQKMLILAGASRSGKGVITKILKSLIGEEACLGTSLMNLSGSHGLELISRAKVATMGDAHHTSKDGIQRTKEVILNITGGDTVAVNPKFKDERSVRIPVRLVVACNDIPMFYDNHNALVNRSSIIPFKKSFDGVEDEGLEAKLLKELPGIVNWAIQGLLDLGREGKFFEGEESLRAKEGLRERQNPTGTFFTEYCELGKDYRVSLSDMYNAYLKYCQLNEIEPDTRKKFFERATESLPGVGKGQLLGVRNSRRPRAYLGMRLREDRVADMVAEIEGFTEVELD